MTGITARTGRSIRSQRTGCRSSEAARVRGGKKEGNNVTDPPQSIDWCLSKILITITKWRMAKLFQVLNELLNVANRIIACFK